MRKDAFQFPFNMKQSILPMLATGLMLSAGLILSAAPALAQNSPEAVRNYNQGFEAYNQGHTADALKHFNKAVQIDPGYGDAYYNMGSIYYQNKQYSEAADMFYRAAKLSPNDGQTKYNEALALEKLQRYDDAVVVLSKIPSSDPKYAQAQMKIDELRPTLKPRNASAAAASKPAASAAKPAAAMTTGKLSTQVFSKGFDGPTGIAIGPGGFMYVANYSKNTIYKVGASGEKNIFAQGEAIKGPIGLLYNSKTNELYVANYLLGSVARINAAGKASTLVSGLNKPYNLFLDTVNNVLYISEQDPANQISRVMLP